MNNLYRQPSSSVMTSLKKYLTVPQNQMNAPVLKNTTIQQAVSEQRRMSEQKTGSDQKKVVDQNKATGQKKATDQMKAVDSKQASDLTMQMRSVTIPSVLLPKTNSEEITQERLQEAVIWSEILGKPLSKRRKRRL